MNLAEIDLVGCARASGDMVGTFASNFHLWKRPGARVMAIFVFHIGHKIPNIGYFEVCGGIWMCMEVFGGI